MLMGASDGDGSLITMIICYEDYVTMISHSPVLYYSFSFFFYNNNNSISTISY